MLVAQGDNVPNHRTQTTFATQPTNLLRSGALGLLDRSSSIIFS
ncbi:hypothetical protein [Chamaesiphon sp.]